MKTSHITAAILVALAPLVAPTLVAQRGGAEDNLLKNGDLRQISADNLPEDWEFSHPEYMKQHETTVEVVSEGAENFLHVVKQATQNVSVGTQVIEIPENASSLRLAIRMRGQNIVRGVETWELPGLTISFKIDEETVRTGDISRFLLLPVGDSDWNEFESIMPVRDGARQAHVTLNGIGWSGTADFAEISVEAIE